MDAAHQQAASRAAFIGADPARHGLRHRAEHAGDDTRLALGIAGDARGRKDRVHQRAGRRNDLDRAERAGVERHVVAQMLCKIAVQLAAEVAT